MISGHCAQHPPTGRKKQNISSSKWELYFQGILVAGQTQASVCTGQAASPVLTDIQVLKISKFRQKMVWILD